MIIVFDIGGTDTKFGIMENNKLILNDKFPTKAKEIGGLGIINNVISKINELSKDYTFKGVAISSAGVINPNTGEVVSATDAIPNYIGVNVKKLVESKTNLTTWINNDVNCFAIAEKHIGNGNGISNFITLTVGTGIGGAIVLNNELVLGKDFSAGEVGRMILNDSTFEKSASISSLVNNAKNMNLNIQNGLDVFNLFDKFDETAIKVVSTFYSNLAKGIINLLYTFNPDKILIGGAISNRKNFINELNEYILKYIDNKSLCENVLDITKNKNDSGLYGAYYNFIEKNK